jgi:hypothetical protein
MYYVYILAFFNTLERLLTKAATSENPDAAADAAALLEKLRAFKDEMTASRFFERQQQESGNLGDIKLPEINY